MQVSLAVKTVYVVVIVGAATGFAEVVLFNPVDGDQLYVEPKGAVGAPPIVTLCPVQIEKLFPASVGTEGLMAIVIVSEPEHPLTSVTFTVYVVVTVGEATGFEIFGLLRVPEGDQL